MRLSKVICFVLLVLLGGFLSACENEPVATPTPEIEYVQVSGIQVSSDTVQLDLKGENIADISGLYNLDGLTLVDLRDTMVDQADIIDFMDARPDCQVLWSVPVYDLTFDNTVDTIFFTAYDRIDATDVVGLVELFDNLEEIYLVSSNILASDYHKVKADYPDINFKMTVTVWGKGFDEETTVIDLADNEDIDEDTLIDELAYFHEVNAILFGDKDISTELKDSLIEKYLHADFEWQTQLLGKEYMSTTAEIDISGSEILDFEAFKHQLKYLGNLSYLDMCDCGLTNTQMEELILECPQVKFVWKICVGSWEMRTDIKAFGTCYDGDFEGGRWIGGGFYIPDSEAMNLKYCKDLVVLDIGHQKLINNYSFLKELTNIKYLIVALSKFEDMTLLLNMEELEYLEIFNTQVSDLSSLPKMPNLKYLNCSQTLILNVDYLVDMDNLEVLWLCNAKHISRSEVARLKESLPDCYIGTDAHGSTRGGWRSYDNQGYVDMREALNMELSF